jgi:hypothetical protein
MVLYAQAGIEAKDGQGGYIPCTGDMLIIETGASTALLIAFDLNAVSGAARANHGGEEDRCGKECSRKTSEDERN